MSTHGVVDANEASKNDDDDEKSEPRADHFVAAVAVADDGDGGAEALDVDDQLNDATIPALPFIVEEI